MLELCNSCEGSGVEEKGLQVNSIYYPPIVCRVCKGNGMVEIDSIPYSVKEVVDGGEESGGSA